MQLKKLILPAAALCGAALLLIPEDSQAFVTFGFQLPLTQRDFRVFNNFTDSSANNNTTAHPNFPGYTGAVMAIWKGSIEWGSGAHNNGQGDTQQTTLGNGGGNFDPSFQGLATGVGGADDNIHSELAGGDGGTLAFTEGVGSNGWRIRYLSDWTWQDGPGAISGGIDLQGVATHEYGHALGLNHTGVSSSTMLPAIISNGVPTRSIESDDIAGVQAVYGVKSASKPTITNAVKNTTTGQVTITGTNFGASGVEVWWTAKTNGNGVPIKNLNVSSTGGGTQIVVIPPATAGPGDVLVKNSGTAGSVLSNAWGFDPGTTGGGGGGPIPNITAANPATVPAVTIDGPPIITLTGTGFTGVTTVTINGVPLLDLPPQFSVVDDSTITLQFPIQGTLGNKIIQVTDADGSDTITVTVVPNTTPALDLVNSDPGFILTAQGAQVNVASAFNDSVILVGSWSPLPSIFPGIVSLNLGNNFTEYVQFPTQVINLLTGYTSYTIPLSNNLPTGFKIYLQAVILPAINPAFPLPVTNLQIGTVLF
jgi:Matrixin